MAAVHSQQQSTTNGAIVYGATSFTIVDATNLRPGMGVMVDQENVTVSLTYTGGLTVPINGGFQYAHISGAPVMWWPNLEPGLTGS